MSQRDWPWKPPNGREARNEQRKLTAALPNAVAIAATVAALLGPSINPSLAKALVTELRVLLGFVAVAAHLLAHYFVRDMEER